MYESFAAAREMQRCWRGARVRWYQREINAAIRAQSRWRGKRSRVAIAKTLRDIDNQAARRLCALYRGWRGREIARRARVEEAELAASELQRMYRGRVGKRLFDVARESNMNRRAKAVQRTVRGRQARRETAGIREEMRLVRESFFDERPASWVKCPKLHEAHRAIVALRDYDAAVDILGEEDNPAFLYASAIALQLAWSRTTKYELWKPSLLHVALSRAKRARQLDPDGSSYAYWLHKYISQGKLDAAGLCIRAVALHTVKTDPVRVLNQKSKHARFRRCRNLYARAKEKDPFRHKPEIEECSAVFEALYATPAKRLGQRRVIFRDTSWLVELFQSGRKLVCSGCNRDNHDDLLDDYVVHESEISTDIATLLLGQEGSAADYVLSHVAVIVAVKNGQERCALSLPGLDRIRDGREDLKRENVCVRRLVNAYRRFDQRAFLKRLVFRRRERDRQDAKLAYRRAIAHLNRLEMRQIASRIQARVRGARVRRHVLLFMSAVRLVQYRVRASLKRVRSTEVPEQNPVVPVCTRGHNLPSTKSGGQTRPHVIVVTRCGRNFKFVAHDLETCAEYVGYCYQSEVDALFPVRHEDDPRLVDFLVENLKLITPLAGIPTADLVGSCRQKEKQVLVVEDPKRGKLEGLGTQETRGLENRQLRDTKHVLRRHNAKIEARRLRQRARGLV